MNIVIGADHGGYELKKIIVEDVRKNGHSPVDLGTHSAAAVDYPDYARAVVHALLDGRGERGILLCGSGAGACVAANKFPGIRAAVCHDSFSARQGVEDDDMNILCLGARVVGPELARELVKTFLAASFSGAVRHVRRLKKIEDRVREVSGLVKSGLKS